MFVVVLLASICRRTFPIRLESSDEEYTSLENALVEGPSLSSLVEGLAVSSTEELYLAAAVTVATLANIGNIWLAHARKQGLETASATLLNVQDSILAERANACFSIRSLEVQTDLVSRSILSYVEFSGAQLKIHSSATQGQLDVLQRALKKGLKLTGRSMSAAVQAACHSASTGELVLQSNIDELQKEILEAAKEMINAGCDLVATVTSAIGTTGLYPKGLQATDAMKMFTLEADLGTNLLQELRANSNLQAGWIPDGIDREMWQRVLEGLNIVYSGAVVAAMAVPTSAAEAVLDLIRRIVSILRSIQGLIQSKGSTDVTIKILGIICNALAAVDDVLKLTTAGATALTYVTNTINALAGVLKLVKSSLQLQHDRGKHRKMELVADSVSAEVLLERSYRTCSTIGTSWKLVLDIAKLLRHLEQEVGVLPLRQAGFVNLSDELNRYVDERPTIAAKVLSRASPIVSSGKEGLPEGILELVSKARAMGRIAPISDFAVAADRMQALAYEQLGFVPVPLAKERGAPLMTCRGCSSDRVLGIVVVKNNDQLESIKNRFEYHGTFQQEDGSPVKAPQYSTLNFVHFQKEHGIRTLAFLKCSVALLPTNSAVLHDLRVEDVYFKGSKKDVVAWQSAAKTLVQQSDVTVLAWSSGTFSPSVAQSVFSRKRTSEIGTLDALLATFTPESELDPLSQGFESHYEELIRAERLAPLGFITVTRGCGCRLGKLGNRYHADSVNIEHWEPRENPRMNGQRIDCSTDPEDYWLSSTNWLNETNAEEMGYASNGSDGLSCTLPPSATKLAKHVDDTSELVWSLAVGNVPFDVEDLLYESYKDPVASSLLRGRSVPFEIWSKFEEGRVSTSSEESLNATLHELQDALKDFLCLRSMCSLADDDNVAEVDTTITKRELMSTVEGFKFTPTRPCGSLARCASRETISFFLGGRGPPSNLNDYIASFGDLIAGSASGLQTTPLAYRAEKLFEKRCCDLSSVMILTPKECPQGQYPRLSLVQANGSELKVSEFCDPVPNPIPVSKYAVVIDMRYHDGELLSDSEEEIETQLYGRGYIFWRESETIPWKLQKQRYPLLWTRTLRQRIYVLYDPRVNDLTRQSVCDV